MIKTMQVHIRHESTGRTVSQGGCFCCFYGEYETPITWDQVVDALNFKLGPGSFKIVEKRHD